ncbi:MAG: DUF4397 domain-containing protein [Lachnospiraceae bacterium]|nr:DUF4397 domain-containing protein [Lachnospiraceae bacterium]
MNSDYNNEDKPDMRDHEPGSMLPNPGEGGPVYPGDNGMMEDHTPVIPLPNPGEGGPVYPGNMNGDQMFPGGGNMNGETGGNNPIENILSGLVGTIITTYPRPNIPCRFCPSGNTAFGVVRFLNAASNYNPFKIYINANMVVDQLNYAEVTEYEKVASGNRTITVMGENGYIYIQKQIAIPQNRAITIAIINTESGLDLFVINDEECRKPLQTGCIRVCNLAVNSGPLNVVIGQQYINFMNVAYKEVTDFKNIWPGDYNFYVSRSRGMARPYMTGNVLLSSTIGIDMNVSYTIYLFHWNLSSPDAVRALIVEEH